MAALLGNERGSETRAEVSGPQVMEINSAFLPLTLFSDRKSESGWQLLK